MKNILETIQGLFGEQVLISISRNSKTVRLFESPFVKPFIKFDEYTVKALKIRFTEDIKVELIDANDFEKCATVNCIWIGY